MTKEELHISKLKIKYSLQISELTIKIEEIKNLMLLRNHLMMQLDFLETIPKEVIEHEIFMKRIIRDVENAPVSKHTLLLHPKL